MVELYNYTYWFATRLSYDHAVCHTVNDCSREILLYVSP